MGREQPRAVMQRRRKLNLEMRIPTFYFKFWRIARAESSTVSIGLTFSINLPRGKSQAHHSFPTPPKVSFPPKESPRFMETIVSFILAHPVLDVLILIGLYFIYSSITIASGDQIVLLERRWLGSHMPDGRTVALAHEVGVQARVLGPEVEL
jgi:hypothetical protein